MNKLIGKVTRVERLGASMYGNPFFRIAIEDAQGEAHIVRTQIDSSLNYAINNPEYREHTHEFKLTTAMRVFDAKCVET